MIHQEVKITMKKKIISALAMLLIAMMLLSTALAAGYVEATAMVNLRSGPGLNYKDVGTIYSGTSLTYLDQYSTDNRGVMWYKVRYNSGSAWISSRYSELYGATAVVYLYATDGQSYLRKAPNLSAKAITVMQQGDAAEYLGSSSVDERGVTWYRVEYNGNTGWVSSRYTSFEQYTRSVYGASGDSTIRNAPNLNGSKLGYLNKGESATYLEASSTDNRGVVWYKIKLDGMIGWVSSKYTKLY